MSFKLHVAPNNGERHCSLSTGTEPFPTCVPNTHKLYIYLSCTTIKLYKNYPINDLYKVQISTNYQTIIYTNCLSFLLLLLFVLSVALAIQGTSFPVEREITPIKTYNILIKSGICKRFIRGVNCITLTLLCYLCFCFHNRNDTKNATIFSVNQ